MSRKLSAILLAALLTLSVAVTGCAGESEPAPEAPAVKDGPTVKVASLLDSEGVVLGTMVIKMLEANGIKTEDKTKFGTPDVVRKALLAGDVDATIDYTGSGQYYTGPEGDPVWNDWQQGFDTIREKDAANGITWLTPSPTNNSEYLAVTEEFSKENNITTMEEFAAFVNGGGTVKLIGDQSWMDNEAGLKAYEKAYGFTLRNDQKIGLANGVTAQFIDAVVNGTDGANVAEVYATDGGLAEQGLVVLADSKNVPPVYAPAPLFRTEIIEAYPEIAEILEPVFQALTMERLQEMNRAVAFGGEAGPTVAENFLRENGFIE